MKNDVFRWRLSSRLKTELEEAARAEGKTFPDLLEEIAKAWLQRNRIQRVDEKFDDVEEEERQRRLYEAAMKCAGTIDGGRPDRAENAQAEVRALITRRYLRTQ